MIKLKMVELFSGIGAQAKALSRVCEKNNKYTFETLNTCEWDIHAIVAYYLIHRKDDDKILMWNKNECIEFLKDKSLSNDGKKSANFKTISCLNLDLLRLICTAIKSTNNLIDVTKINGEDIPNNLDILTYSFPCQDLSNVGALHGYLKGIDRDAHSRSGLLWEVERILKERRQNNLDLPKFLVMENVTSLLAKRHIKNFEDWQHQLEQLGYVNKIFKMEASKYGIPQHRKRLIMLSVYVGNENNNKNIVNKYFDKLDKSISKYVPKITSTIQDLLKLDYKNKKYFSEALLSQPKDTPSRKKIWDSNVKILDEKNNFAVVSATITTKQDRHPNSGNIYFDYKGNKKSKYRFLTPRECFLLMGFEEIDYEKLIDNNVLYGGRGSLFFSRDKLYKLAGNSIVVNVLEPIFNSIEELYSLLYLKK